MAKCKEEFCDQPTMGEGYGYKRCVDHSPPTQLREYIASLEDTRATALRPDDESPRRLHHPPQRRVGGRGRLGRW